MRKFDAVTAAQHRTVDMFLMETFQQIIDERTFACSSPRNVADADTGNFRGIGLENAVFVKKKTHAGNNGE